MSSSNRNDVNIYFEYRKKDGRETENNIVIELKITFEVGNPSKVRTAGVTDRSYIVTDIKSSPYSFFQKFSIMSATSDAFSLTTS